MSFDREEIAALRRAWAWEPEPGDGTPECVGPDRIWAAANAELPPEETGEIVDHVIECRGCAESWRFAAVLGDGLAARDQETPVPETRAAVVGRRRAVLTRHTLAVAATLVLVIAAGWLGLRGVPGPESGSETVVRQAVDPAFEEPALRSLLDEDQPLDRGDAELRWSPLEGATYDLYVTNLELDEIATVRGLTEARYVLEPSRFEGLPAGSVILWRVEARGPNGERAETETSMARVQ